MDVSSLPPMPDRETGEPRPPRAPLEGFAEDRDRERDRGKMPPPPAGQGPVLEWYQSSRRGAIQVGLFMLVLLVAFFTFRDRGLGWITDWVLWLVVAAGSLVMFLVIRRNRMAAGADWFKRTRRHWVKTYELVSVRVVGAWGSAEIELKDADGRKVSVSFLDVQQNRALWDLVYNGILHSAVSGRATVTGLARERLKLPAGLATVAEGGRRFGRAAGSRPRSMGTAGKVVHVVLMILFAVAGAISLGIAAVGVVSGDAFDSGFNIAFSVFLVAVGAGFAWGYVWLKRRLER